MQGTLIREGEKVSSLMYQGLIIIEQGKMWRAIDVWNKLPINMRAAESKKQLKVLILITHLRSCSNMVFES